MRTQIVFSLNGSKTEVTTEPDRTLLEILREDLGLTGTKYGCGEGACGACTVLVNGEPTRSCALAISQAAGTTITTIEGLGSNGSLHPLQEAFIAQGAAQCGYCTPGMVLGAVALLQRNPDPSEAEVIEGMNGHLCRCSNYLNIVKAIRRAAATKERES